MNVRLSRNPSQASVASYIHTMISMLNEASLNGHAAYVDWRSQPAILYADNRGGNQWEWWLEQPMLKSPENTADATWTFEDGPSWHAHCPISGEMPWNAQSDVAIAMLRKIVSQFLKILPGIQHHGAVLFERHGIDPAKTVAVSYRGTDKHKEAVIEPPVRFFDAIDRCVADGLTVWIKAEQAEAVAEFRKRYPQAVVMDEFYLVSGSGLMADAVNPKSGYQKGLDAIVTLWMLSRCKVLVKNAGNLSDLAAGLSTGEVVCVN